MAINSSSKAITISTTEIHSPLSSDSINITTKYWPEISGVIIFCICLLFAFKEGVSAGIKKATKASDENFTNYKNEVQNALNELQRSNDRLNKSINNSKLIPDNHALIRFDKESSKNYTTADGYIMRVEARFEHRIIAEEILCRKLQPNEEVHHIYYKKTGKSNNSPSNLCVLDREDHQFFHDIYMPRKLAQNNGHYLTTPEQKLVLKRQFRGILLEDALAAKRFVYEPIPPHPSDFVFMYDN